MSLIDVKLEPSKKDLRIFAIVWVVFFIILGKLSMLSDAMVFNAAAFTSVCLVISLLINREHPRWLQLWGVLIPGFLWSAYAVERWAAGSGVEYLTREQTYIGIASPGSHWLVLGVLMAVGVVGTLAMLLIPGAAKRVYRVWMFAALPIGWTVSHIVLGIVFYLVFTPIGLVMRLVGKDPMQRGFDREANTYWRTRTSQRDMKRYFRQF